MTSLAFAAQQLGHIPGNLLRRQVVLPQNLRHIVTIQKFLLQPIIQHLLMGAAIKPGNLFTKTAIQNTILQRDDHLVILFELFQQVYIKPTDIARVNQRWLHARLNGDRLRCCFAKWEEGPERKNRRPG